MFANWNLKAKYPVGSWIGVFNLSNFFLHLSTSYITLWSTQIKLLFFDGICFQPFFKWSTDLLYMTYMLHFTSLYFLYNIRYIYIIFSVENCKPVHRLHCVGKTLSFITYLGLIYFFFRSIFPSQPCSYPYCIDGYHIHPRDFWLDHTYQ